MMGGVPETRYVKAADGLNIAYKVFGEGPVDLLFLWQIPLAFDSAFEHPAHLRYWRFVSSFARVIGYDRRGLGASDPAPPESFADRRVWAEDAVAVLDAVGAGQVIVQGEGFGGHEALALAVAHPERTRGLVLVNSFARLVQAGDYPIGVEADFVDAAVEFTEGSWGTGAIAAGSVPHLASESSFRDLWGPFERMAASPATAAACVRAMYTSDVRDLLASISVPTLVMYTGDLAFVAAEHSRYLAEHIPGSTLIETPVQSFWGFDPAGRRAMREFISGISNEVAWERELLALLFTDIVSSTERALALGDAAWREVIEDHDAYVRAEVTRNHGRVIKQTGDGHLAAFSHPVEAIRTAVRVRDGARVQGFEVRAGLHFGEVGSRSDGDVTGSAVNVAARVMQHAGAGEVLVSHTLTDLVTGSDIEFEDHGEHELKGVPGGWRLFLVRT
jgi:class 3 adenylate cyclase